MDEIVDYNEKFVGVIENIISFNKLSHAYIIEVNDYDSDYLLVEAFVKLILCKNNVKKVSDLNCDKCEICRLVDEGNYPDVLVVEPDGKEIKNSSLFIFSCFFRIFYILIIIFNLCITNIIKLF